MIQRVFIDTDVFLDTVLQRTPHDVSSGDLLGMCEKAQIEAYSSTLILANLYYILRKVSSHAKAVQSIGHIRSFIKILALTDKEIGESIQAGFPNFEDGLQYFICVNHNIGCFITRNAKDFKKAVITVLSPKEFLQTFSQKN